MRAGTGQATSSSSPSSRRSRRCSSLGRLALGERRRPPRPPARCAARCTRPHPRARRHAGARRTRWGPLIRRYAPRARAGARRATARTTSVPVDFAQLPRPGVRRATAPRGRSSTCTSCGARRRLHPLLALLPGLAHHAPADAALAGTHRDDWEGVIVRLAPTARRRRATAHGGLAGMRPVVGARARLAPDRPPGRSIYRAAGSHANGFAPGDIDLAGDRWNGTLGEVRPAFDRRRPGPVAAAAVRPGGVAAVDEAPLARPRRGRHRRRRSRRAARSPRPAPGRAAWEGLDSLPR